MNGSVSGEDRVRELGRGANNSSARALQSAL